MNLRLDLLNLNGFDEKGLRRLDQWTRQLIQALTRQTREVKYITLNPTTDFPVSVSTVFTNPQFVQMLRANSTTQAKLSYLSPCQVEWEPGPSSVTILGIPDLPNDTFRIILEIRGDL